MPAAQRDEGRRRPPRASAGGEGQRGGDGGGDLLRGEAEEAEPRGGAVAREVVPRGHAQRQELAEVWRELDAAESGLHEGKLGCGEAWEDGHPGLSEVSENRRGGGRRCGGRWRSWGTGCRGAGGEPAKAGSVVRMAREAVRERRPVVNVDHC